MAKMVMAALGGALAGGLLVTQVAAPLIAQENDSQASIYEQLDLFGDILERIRAQYVEEVDEAELIEAAINGMLVSLDPHSSYLTADDFEDMRTQTRGEFGGLGIEVTQEEGFVKVVSAIDDTRAAEAGIAAGEFITHVDGDSVLGLTLDEAVDLMRGPVGSEIVITVAREGTDEPFDVSIIRDTIKLVAVRSRTVGDTVVLRITTFNDQTFAGVQEELASQVESLGGMENVDGFVLDLRNNPGGLLSSAIDVCGEFLRPNTTVLTTRGRVDSQNPPPYRTSETQRRARNYPVAILINQTSASGAEVVAGALQDLKRAVIVGETSFGKGSVQSIIAMGRDTGAAMRLTTAKYYTPSQKVIHENGVTPNIEIPLTPDEERDLARWRNRANLGQDEQQELEHFRDRQLERAVDAMKGALVYHKRSDRKPAKPEAEGEAQAEAARREFGS